MKKTLKIIFCLLFIFLIVGCNHDKDDVSKKSINIIILDDNLDELYNKNIESSYEKLVDVLNDDNFSLIIEDGPYGAYIVSLMDLKQKNVDEGMYYWSYYINDEYADVGISNCKIKDGYTYKFVYEFYEN